ncbi:MAG: AAA family ATPase [Pseudomonadota bacterium]
MRSSRTTVTQETLILVGNIGDQARIIRFLEQAESYGAGAGVGRVERIDTHAAIVFLAGEFAYKIKRAVALAYLDFSTLEKRREVCRRELDLNRRTAPQLYISVVPVTQQPDGALAIDGDGTPVEWAVKMRRFDNAMLFDRLAVAGDLTIDDVDRVARNVASFHATIDVVRDQAALASLRTVVDTTFRAPLRAQSQIDPKDATATLKLAGARFEALSPLLAGRLSAGFVRHCHGDLHLKNIVRIDGQPTLFDAIEFDQSIATVDVLYDLAFLLMDLWQRGLKHHANVVLNRYLYEAAARENLAGLAALPLFLSLRAAVRCMVSIDQLTTDPEHAGDPVRRDVARYFDWAKTFLAPPAPRLVAIGGRSGTGKSTVAALLAPDLGAAPGAVHIRSDRIRKRIYGVDELIRLDPEAYQPEASRQVYQDMFAQAADALAAGHSVVLDAVFLKPDERAEADALARRMSVPFDGVWLDADADVLVGRVTRRVGDASDADAKVVALQFGRETGDITWPIVDANGSADDVVRRVEAILVEAAEA